MGMTSVSSETVSNASRSSSKVSGGASTPASSSTVGLNHMTLERWMFTGTE